MEVLNKERAAMQGATRNPQVPAKSHQPLPHNIWYMLLLFVVWLYLKWSSKTGLNLMTMVPLIIREKKNI